jgi:hypothetical protein
MYSQLLQRLHSRLAEAGVAQHPLLRHICGGARRAWTACPVATTQRGRLSPKTWQQQSLDLERCCLHLPARKPGRMKFWLISAGDLHTACLLTGASPRVLHPERLLVDASACSIVQPPAAAAVPTVTEEPVLRIIHCIDSHHRAGSSCSCSRSGPLAASQDPVRFFQHTSASAVT